MTVGNGFELVVRHDISMDEHIKYVVGVLSDKSHETYGLETVLEAINFSIPIKFKWHPDRFLDGFAKYLAKTDVIRHPTHEEVFKLSSRIIAITGRNFTLIDLIKSWETVLHARDVQIEALAQQSKDDEK